MFNFMKQKLADVAGTAEPIYGPSAIQPVTEQAKETPYTELKKEDLKWIYSNSTNVETACFYLNTPSGYVGMAQVIYSNVGGIHVTAQFNAKIFYPNQSKPPLWSSKPVSKPDFSDDRYNFYAENVSVTLSDEGDVYSIKSAVDEGCLVDLKVKKVAPGFNIGKNGTSNFGTDPQKPWGKMLHSFWPMCDVEGKFILKDGEIDWTGRGVYIHAFQGMKPHHAAAKWNFVNLQTPDYSAIMMEFTTPPSYGDVIVNVGSIVKKGEIIFANASSTATHTIIKKEADDEWPAPGAAEYRWQGKTKDGKDATAVLAGDLGPRTDRVDVMAELPKFVKSILAAAAGTKPYIYQFTPKLKLKLNIGGEEVEQEGQLFTEATFISGESSSGNAAAATTSS